MSVLAFFADLPSTWQWAIAVWLAALGGCIGSFLNVVVYRVPAGKSLIRPGSFCPKCKHPIRWYDNVPVFGWLALGGKCRDCGEPISARYPLVEALCAAMFFGLGWVELLSDGANLPLREVVLTPKRVISSGYAPVDLVSIYAFHLLVLCTLLAAALISHDRARVPFRLFAPALLAGLLGWMFWPRMFSGRIDMWDSGPVSGPFMAGFIVVIGLVIGWLLGQAVPSIADEKDTAGASLGRSGTPRSQGRLAALWGKRNTTADGILFGSACVAFLHGAVLPLALAVLVLTLLNRVALRIGFRWPFVNPVVWLAALTPLWLVFDRQLTDVIGQAIRQMGIH